MRLLELRTYRLKPGTGPTLHDAFIRKGIPLVKQAGMDVVAFGFSAEDIIEHIDSYQDTLLWLSSEAVEQLRRDLAGASRP